MAVELIAGLGLFKSMLDAAKGLKNINDAAVRNAAVIELQGKILAAQEQQMALVERVGELEEEVARSKTWDTEKQRYHLAQLAPGTAAYLVKEDARGTEPPHCICTNCYEDGKKSVLHLMKDGTGTVHISCPRCKSKMTCWGDHGNFPIVLD